MITSLLNRLIAREDLTQTEAAALLAEMMVRHNERMQRDRCDAHSALR
jgi:hypothetical protein